MSLVIFDLETGGLELTHPIIQIAAVAVNAKYEIVDSFQAKLKFDTASADPNALEMNHFNPKVWEDQAIAPIEACRQFAMFLEVFKSVDCIFKAGMGFKRHKLTRGAAFNAQFDAPRIQKLFKDNGVYLPMEPRVLCILQLAMWQKPIFSGKMPSYKLSAVAKRLGISADGAHDALADCSIAAKVLKALQETKEEVAAYMIAREGKLCIGYGTESLPGSHEKQVEELNSVGETKPYSVVRVRIEVVEAQNKEQA